MLEKVINILSKYSEATDITADSALAADLHLSSFDLIAIVTDFEDEFDIEVPDRDIRKFVTVKDVVQYLMNFLFKY